MPTPTPSAAPKQVLSGLANRLVASGLLAEEKAIMAQQESVKEKAGFVVYLVEKKLIPAYQLAYFCAQDFGLPLLDASAVDVEVVPKGVVSEKLILKHHALPILKRKEQLFVAISDPTNIEALHEIKFHTGLSTRAIIVEEDKLAKLIDTVLGGMSDSNLGDLSDSDLEGLDISASSDEAKEDDSAGADDAPIVRFVNKILLDAIKAGASDIHFEPYEKRYRVRLRIDGILQEVASPPVNLAGRLAARLKVMSKLDIAERRVPQDGHFKMKISKTRTIEFRISVCPMVAGEKVVMRILDPSNSSVGIEALGYEDFQKKAFISAIEKPQGMVLVTGPTGSGKTVSLYTALNILNTEDTNISTAEDPVELNVEGVNQVHVNPKAGLTFAEALRSFLRQDPDVIMVGEIRDLETAEIGIKAAQTGHLVLSTLHTNSAPETLTRLVNMGVERFNIATSVNLIVAQRLARRLCAHCKQPLEVPREALLELGYKETQLEQITLFKPVGCEKCTGGYKGRVGLYEVLELVPDISRVIMEGGNSLDILDKAREFGFQTLRESALKKAAQGVTSLEEVNRVTKE